MIYCNINKEHQTVHNILTFFPKGVNAMYLNLLQRLPAISVKIDNC